jgi:hypothetical protein
VDVLNVEGQSLLESLLLMDLTEKPLPKLHVMGHKERMSFRVIGVEIGARLPCVCVCVCVCVVWLAFGVCSGCHVLTTVASLH